MDKKNIPYPYPADMARQNDEIHLYRESFQTNKACAEMIDKVIQASRYEDNGYDLRTAVNDVIDAYGTDRMNWVLANTLQNNEYDRRFSRSNTEWAKGFAIPKDRNMSSYELKSHPEHINNFILKAREICSEHYNAHKQEKPSILGQVKENAASITQADKKDAPNKKNELEVT